jgi:hypothetical protein
VRLHDMVRDNEGLAVEDIVLLLLNVVLSE